MIVPFRKFCFDIDEYSYLIVSYVQAIKYDHHHRRRRRRRRLSGCRDGKKFPAESFLLTTHNSQPWRRASVSSVGT